MAELVLTVHFKQGALNELAGHLRLAQLTGLLSEEEARRVAEDLLTTEPSKFLDVKMGDLVK